MKFPDREKMKFPDRDRDSSGFWQFFYGLKVDS